MNRMMWGVAALTMSALGACQQSKECEAGVYNETVRSCVGRCPDGEANCRDGGVVLDVATDVLGTDVATSCVSPQVSCGGRCVDVSADPNHCGRCDMRCATSDSGAASCNAGSCRLDCNAGTHACSHQCVSNDSVMSCGTSCMPCATPAGARSTCVMGMCGFECLPGFERNGMACDVIVPRPVFPPGTSTVTSLRPTLRWASAMGVDGARVEICRDRACTMLVETIDATATSAQPTANLPTSTVLFWRIAGRVGSMTGARRSATWQFRTRATNTAVDTAHGVDLDINGDGFSDVAVVNRTGTATVHLGSAAGVRAAATTTVTRTVTMTPLVAPQRLVGAAGDVDGDGFGDVIIGTPAESPAGVMFAGCVRLFRGADTGVSSTPSWTFCNDETGANAGIAVAGIGDVNGDGFGDIGVGVASATPGGLTGAGKVLVFHGSATGLSAVASRAVNGTDRGGQFGSAVAQSIDTNGDRLSDLVVGADGAGPTGGGVAALFVGTASGLSATFTTLSGPSAADLFGCAIGSGDFNGDGFGDFVVGASLGTSAGAGSNAGNASLYLGARTGVTDSVAVLLRATQDSSFFGHSVAGVGDTNRDGFDDLVVGAPTGRPAASSGAGNAFLFRGSAAGLPATASQTLDGAAMGDNLGMSVGGGGDVNGDGFRDVIVGATGADPGGRNIAGIAVIYSGSAAGVSMALTLEGPTAGDNFGASVASSVRPLPARARAVYHPLACDAQR